MRHEGKKFKEFPEYLQDAIESLKLWKIFAPPGQNYYDYRHWLMVAIERYAKEYVHDGE